MLISVIIPVYNGMDVIGQCLDSVLAGDSSHELEIICVEDCSNDQSYSLIKNNYPQVKLYRNDSNKSYAFTVNRGIKKSSGEFLLLLNQDTVISADTIKILAEKLKAREDVGIVAPKLVNPDGSVQASVRRFPTHSDIIYHHLGLNRLQPDNPQFNRWKISDFDHDLEQEILQPAFSAVMLKRKLISTIGLLDQDFPLFFNDVDYCRRTIEAGWKILYTPQTAVEHIRGQAALQNVVRATYLSHEAFIRYMNKYYRGIKYILPNFICSVLLVFSAHVRVIFRLIKRAATSKA